MAVVEGLGGSGCMPRAGVGNLFDSESQESKILKNLFQ